ncbi:iron ABC transporter permease [Staphylococcus roterodami]|nr:iron ABC transporter permease [Staphylococcus roterodami]UMT81205.1 iron ABC transporter permease [Staphylococcus roterodami]
MTKKESQTTLKFVTYVIGLSVLLVIALFISTLMGDAKIQASTILEAVFNYDPSNQQQNVINEIRIPRNIAAVIVGMALAVSGAIIQGVTRNGLADPALIGLNSGASFALALTYSLLPGTSFLVLMFAGFLGAILGGAIVLMMGRSRRDGFNPMRIILAGAAVSAMLTALSQGIALAFRLNQTVTFWTAGGVAGTTWTHLKWAIPLIGIALLIILMFSKQLTILNLGESLATGLGQSVTVIRGICLIIAMILAGISVAIAGQVAFVGLMVPHIARFLIGTDYTKILPLTALLGGLLVLVADVIARYLGEAPVGAIISFIGVPYFLYLVKKGGRTI